MSDLYHYWGTDLTADSTGDLQTVDGATLTQQRIIRRLMTNPGEYIWQPDYGAGLPAKVGMVFNAAEITGLIRGQILMESTVAKTPEPVITVTEIANGMAVQIQYTDALSNAPTLLNFDVTA